MSNASFLLFVMTLGFIGLLIGVGFEPSIQYACRGAGIGMVVGVVIIGLGVEEKDK